jgi:hypothetical protein
MPERVDHQKTDWTGPILQGARPLIAPGRSGIGRGHGFETGHAPGSETFEPIRYVKSLEASGAD